MASAFEGVKETDAEQIRRLFLAGRSMVEIRDHFVGANGRRTFNVQRMREMRDEVFEPFVNDVEKVKALANGPVLNANEIVRYKRPLDRAKRMARPGPVQTEMFPA